MPNAKSNRSNRVLNQGDTQAQAKALTGLGPSRRSLLGVMGVLAGGAVGAQALSGTERAHASPASQATTVGPHEVCRPEAFGARADGQSDDTDAVVSALRAATLSSRTVELSGVYRISRTLDIPGGISVVGKVRHAGLLSATGGPAIRVREHGLVHLRDFSIHLAHARGLGIEFDGAFRNIVERVAITGMYGSRRDTKYRYQIGLNFVRNSGDNRVIACEISNLGIGIRTLSIMNYVVATCIGTCMTGVQGGYLNEAGSAAGLSLQSCTIVARPGEMGTGVSIHGTSNNWWLEHVWIEGAEVGMSVGSAGHGPMLLSISGGHFAGTRATLRIRGAHSVVLSGLALGANPNARPILLDVSGSVVTGVANGVSSSTPSRIERSQFPKHWQVAGSGPL